MREAENIRAVAALDVDMIGLIFAPRSPRYVSGRSSRSGIIPDWGRGLDWGRRKGFLPLIVGVFVDATAQDIITRVYNYGLSYVQLHGDESPVFLRNLRRTLVPDIVPDIRLIKAISVREADDVKRWRDYADSADVLLFDTKTALAGGSGKQFDWRVLEAYDGPLPFLLSGGIGPGDAERVRAFRHPRCIGIDLNSRFETAPAYKDVAALQTFINELKAPVR